MNNEIQALLEAIKTDYVNWWSRSGDRDLTDIQKNMVEEFNAGLEVEEGRKYIKIISSRSVWGFIVKADTNKFRKGDILKAASWRAPATNAPRGNILDGGYSIQWTGPNYL